MGCHSTWTTHDASFYAIYTTLIAYFAYRFSLLVSWWHLFRMPRQNDLLGADNVYTLKLLYLRVFYVASSHPAIQSNRKPFHTETAITNDVFGRSRLVMSHTA